MTTIQFAKIKTILGEVIKRFCIDPLQVIWFSVNLITRFVVKEVLQNRPPYSKLISLEEILP